MAEVMSEDQIRQQVSLRQEQARRAEVADMTRRYTYVRPLMAAAYDLIDWMGNEEQRLMFGLPEVDAAIRGVARGELCYLTGRAHSGKTQLVLHMIQHNPTAKFLYFTPDEVDNLVLCKLISLVHGVNAEELEQRIKDGDERAKMIVAGTAHEVFPNLLVIDQGLTFDQMTLALHEAEQAWGGEADGVIVDYLDLLPGNADFDGTKGKSTHLKRWTKRFRVPMVCIHQPKRGGAARGEKIGMDDMNMGGETEATFVLGVYRKADDPFNDQALMHRDTISVNISKNKRPPCHVGEFDYYLDPYTGVIREIRPEDLIPPGVPVPNYEVAQAVIAKRREVRRTTDDVIDLATVRAEREHK